MHTGIFILLALVIGAISAIVGQLIMAMIVSHFGVLEVPQDPVTIK